jgi:NAD-dependent SIR2 family protein deacetylase
MVIIYCRGNNHIKDGICIKCKEILEYARNKTRNCIHKGNKPTCRKCKTHCYNELNRKAIKDIMRYSRTRMIFKHPIKSINHLIKEIL